MRKRYTQSNRVKIIFSFLMALTLQSFAQSPYSISPKWYFGRQAGLDFTSGSPVLMSGGLVDGTGQEAASTMCEPNGNVIFYSDSRRLYNGNNTFSQFVNGGTSSTNSSISFPDPASPANQFYFVTASQDAGGGGDFGATLGIYYYHLQKSGPGTITVLSGPTLLATNTQVSEQLCGGSDGNGGYWVVAHQGGGAGNGNQIWTWNFTASGVGTKQISSIAGTDAATNYQGSLKINRCQNRLAAVFFSGKVEVYDWDQTTGKVTALYRTYSIPGGFGYGCEFSPDGNMLYFTSLIGNQLYQFDLTANTVSALAGGTSSNNIAEMGTLQLGPDDKIYVTNVANYAQPCYIGVVNNPNVSGAGCNYNRQGFLLNNSVGNWPNIYRGIANEAWINPTLALDTTGNCKALGFSYSFQTYFGSNVAIVPNSEQWDFGDGGGFQSGLGATPSHTYASGGTYTITLKVTDATCSHVWTVSQTIVVNNCGGCSTVAPPTAIAITPGKDICDNLVSTVTLTASGGNSADALEWFAGGACGGASVFTGASLVLPSVPVAGTYVYSVRRVNATCGNSACLKDSFVVHVNPTAPASTTNPTFCQGATGSTNLVATGGSGEQLAWYQGGCGTGSSLGNAATLSRPIPNTVGSTFYFVRWESVGCTPSTCVKDSITVNALPTPSITGVSSICLDSIQNYSVSNTAGSTFNWTFTTSGTGTILSGQGTNSISLNVGDAGGTLTLSETITATTCANQATRNITLNMPSGTNALAGADKNSCTTSIGLNANNTAGSWSVYSGTGVFSPSNTVDNPTVSGLSNGVNEFIWTTTGTCGFVDRDTVAVTVGASSLSVVAFANADTVCVGSPKEIQVVVTGGGSGIYTYVWTSSDNSFTASTTSPAIVVNPASLLTQYHVEVTDKINSGCTAEDDIEVAAIANQELVVPNLITPNGDTQNDFLEIRDENEFRILPGSTLEIHNRWGDRVYEHSSYDNSWNAQNLSDGVYYYYLKSGCGNKVYKGWVQIVH